MKSKAHRKKCMEMGVPEGVIEDQDAEDSGTGLGFGRQGSSSHGVLRCYLQTVAFIFK